MAMNQADIDAIVSALTTALSNSANGSASSNDGGAKTPSPAGQSAGGPEPSLQPSNSNPATDAGSATPNTMGGTDNETVPAGSGGSPNAGAGDTQAKADGASQMQPASEGAQGASGKQVQSVMPNQQNGMAQVSSMTIDQVAGMSAEEINNNWAQVSELINGLGK